MTPIFRYSKLDIFLILNTLALIALPFYMAIYTTFSVWWIVVGILHSYLIANLQNTSLHHQSHWPMFNKPSFNRYYEILLSMPSGFTNQGWKWAHLLHHKHVNDKPVDGKTKDPASVFLGGKNGQPLNFWKYTVGKATADIYCAFFKIRRGSTGIKQYQQQFLIEDIAIKLFFLSIAIINFKYLICLSVIYYFAYAENRAISYGEHWTVLDRRGDTTQDSISAGGFWCNLIGFGAGLHQEHHHKPGVHWSNYRKVTPLLSPKRKFIKGWHITNNPFWSHFKLLFKE